MAQMTIAYMLLNLLLQMAYNADGVILPDKVWALVKALMNPRATNQDVFSSPAELLLAFEAELSSLELVISCSPSPVSLSRFRPVACTSV